MLEQLGRPGRADVVDPLEADAHRDVAHVLDARADRGVVDAGGDQGGGEVDGLLGGAALAVDRRGGRLDRQTGLEPGVAADVEHLLAVLLDTAGDDVLDLRGVDAGALDHLGVGLAEQLVGVGVLVVALLRMPAPDRRPNCLDDDYLTPVAVSHSGKPTRLTDQSTKGANLAHQLGIVGQRGDRARARAGRRGAPRRGRLGAQRAVRRARRREGRRAPRVVTDLDELAGCDIVVEAVAEDTEAKCDIHRQLGELLPAETMSPPPPRRCRSPSWPPRAAGPTASRALHVFNPVEKMKLVELSFPDEATAETKLELHRLCERLEQDRGRGARRGRLRRQQAALPLPLRRGAPARARRHRRRRASTPA